MLPDWLIEAEARFDVIADLGRQGTVWVVGPSGHNPHGTKDNDSHHQYDGHHPQEPSDDVGGHIPLALIPGGVPSNERVTGALC